MCKEYFILLAILIPCFLQAQYQIKGRILNAEDKTPLPYATVFLSKTSKGTSSNSAGEFLITNVPEGHFDLVVSFVGFETLVVPITPKQQKTYTLMLMPSTLELAEVTIYDGKVKRADWDKNYRLFERNFIGLSENSSLCKILNPKVLKFDERGWMLRATADSALLIENRALGYNLKVMIEQYSLNTSRPKIVYKTKMFFEYLEAANGEEEKFWARNRLKAYEGSEMHFMRSIYNRSLIEEGFFIRVSTEEMRKGKVKMIAKIDTTLYIDGSLIGKKLFAMQTAHVTRILDGQHSTSSDPVLSFAGHVEVTFIHELESFDYQRTRLKARAPIARFQKSNILLSKPSAKIDKNGSTSSEDVMTQGYWTWELIADSLPIDYRPDDDMKILDRVDQGENE